MSIGRRIKQARSLRSRSQRALADAISVGASTISAYENGQKAPDSAQLIEIADALGLDLSFFLRGPRVKSVEPVYRKFASLKKRDQEALHARIHDWIERYLEIEEIVGVSSEFEWPNGFPRAVQSMNEVEAAALALRDAWDIGHDPIEHLTGRLEDLPLHIAALSTPDDFDACAFEVRVNGGLPAIVFNADRPGDRQRFSIAHELGHLALSVDESSELDIEEACDRFAGAFLVPRRSLKNAIGSHRTRIRREELDLLKARYGVSMQMLLYRMGDLSLLPEDSVTWWFKRINQHGYRKSEPGPDVPAEHPQRMERLIQRALAEDLITERRAAQLLDPRSDDTSSPVPA